MVYCSTCICDRGHQNCNGFYLKLKKISLSALSVVHLLEKKMNDAWTHKNLGLVMHVLGM
jgi:hypothetical protein